MLATSREAKLVVGVTGVRDSWLIRSVELVTLNGYGRGANWLILLLKDLASLLAGALRQLTTGRMGRSGLCNLNKPFMEGADTTYMTRPSHSSRLYHPNIR
jgi:hypothetical protein